MDESLVTWTILLVFVSTLLVDALRNVADDRRNLVSSVIELTAAVIIVLWGSARV
jgi:hypothetical protein